jgi:hypothetical protein
MTAVLVDTNILVYSHDRADPVKQTLSIEILDHLHTIGIGRLSAQVLAKFFAATTSGKQPLLPVNQASNRSGMLPWRAPL